MISEFEKRLAEVLGARLPDPFRGNVEVASGTAGGTDPQILVGVQQAEVVEPDLGSRRPEIVPGSTDNRRVMRLNCTVGVEVRAGTGGNRGQQIQGLDAALYALDAPDFRNGTALITDADSGFLIQHMQLTQAIAPLNPTLPNLPLIGLTLSAQGWFWVVGTIGESGRQIGEIRIRGVALPLKILPATPDLVVGGSPIEFTLRLAEISMLRLNQQPDALPQLPFGFLALTVVGSGGRPGAGQLSGGSPGSGGVQLATLTEGTATIRYTPPAQPAIEELVVGLSDGTGGLGIELGRFALKVRGAE